MKNPPFFDYTIKVQSSEILYSIVVKFPKRFFIQKQQKNNKFIYLEVS